MIPQKPNLGRSWMYGGKVYSNRSVSLSQVKADYEKAKRDGFQDFRPEVTALGSVLKELSRADEINTRRIGWWFKRNVGVFVNGRHFERVSGSGSDIRYRLLG